MMMMMMMMMMVVVVVTASTPVVMIRIFTGNNAGDSDLHLDDNKYI